MVEAVTISSAVNCVHATEKWQENITAGQTFDCMPTEWYHYLHFGTVNLRRVDIAHEIIVLGVVGLELNVFECHQFKFHQM